MTSHIGFGDKDAFERALQEDPVKPWIIFDSNTGELIRVVQCQQAMVMMSGSWSSNYRMIAWDDCLKLIRDQQEAQK